VSTGGFVADAQGLTGGGFEGIAEQLAAALFELALREHAAVAQGGEPCEVEFLLWCHAIAFVAAVSNARPLMGETVPERAGWEKPPPAPGASQLMLKGG